YVETFRAAFGVVGAGGAFRSASTAIYFLLGVGEFSAFHRVAADEAWHHYLGDPLELHTIDATGEHVLVRLGKELLAGERPQHVVPAGTWQAARVAGSGFSLCGCTVAPGFDFADFEMPSRAELLARFPQHAELIESFGS